MTPTPTQIALELGKELGKAILERIQDEKDREHALAVAHQKAESTIRFHVLTAKKHKAKRKGNGG